MVPTALQSIALMTQWTEFDAGAERMAIELARRLKLPLTVIVPLFSNPEFEVVAHDLVADAEAATAHGVADFKARVQAVGVTAEIRVRRGDELWREVVEEARTEQVGLIVTRRRGHRGFLGKLKVGEMVRQIAAHAPCPLMMVPREAKVPSHGILVAIDAESNLEPAIASAATLASALGLTLEVLVAPSAQTPEVGGWAEQARSIARRAGLKVEVTVGHEHLVDAVASRQSAGRADLLVLGIEPSAARHGKLGDAVEAIVGGSACATLLVHTQPRPSL